MPKEIIINTLSGKYHFNYIDDVDILSITSEENKMNKFDEIYEAIQCYSEIINNEINNENNNENNKENNNKNNKENNNKNNKKINNIELSHIYDIIKIILFGSPLIKIFIIFIIFIIILAFCIQL
jgi:hypothetical protein